MIYTPVNTGIFLALAWAIPFSVIIMPYAVGATELGYDNGPHLCSDLEDRPDGTVNHLHMYLAGSFLTCIPLTIVMLVYLRIYVFIQFHIHRQKAWKAEHAASASTGQPRGGQKEQQPPQQQQQAQQTQEQKETQEGQSPPQQGSTSGNPPGPEAPENGAAKATNQISTVTSSAPQPAASAKGNSLEHRITKNTFYVVLGFIICVIPYGTLVLSKWGRGPGVKGSPIAQGFLLFNVCMNPLIYGTKHPHFRGAMRRVLKGRLSGPLATSTVAPSGVQG